MAKNRFSDVTPRNRTGRENGIENANNIEELRTYMYDNYKIKLHKQLDVYDLDATKTYLTGVEEMLNEFPQLKGEVQEIGGLIGGRALGGMSFDGRLLLNPKSMRNLAAAEATYQASVESGYFPQGTTAKGTTIHEMGHAIEAYLIKQRYSDEVRGYASKRVRAWKNGEISKEIVNSALDRLFTGWRRKKSLAAGAVLSISRYAASNSSETIAEAVSDYMANKGKASALSREIWNELKNRVK